MELGALFGSVMPHLNEVQRRLVAGAVARSLGHGGKSRVASASGLSRNTVIKGQAEVEAGVEPSDRLRAPGAGDKKAIDKQPGLLAALDELVHPDTRGNPMSPLRWTLKSTYELARELTAQGFQASAELVRRTLHDMGYSLQAPAKQNEGSSHPDRDGQFNWINALAAERLEAGEPVISVDTKKKELIGDYANGGREWQPAGEPERVNVHDFADRALGEFAKAIPYGVYDIANNAGWVSVGDVADTAEFAVESIRRWWNTLGRERFPDATRLMITAEVEQDRTQTVLVHLDELARQTTRRHPHHHRTHLRHHHPDRTHRPSRLRPDLVPQRREDQQHRLQRAPTPTTPLARRMELRPHPNLNAQTIPRRALTLWLTLWLMGASMDPKVGPSWFQDNF